VSRNAPLVSRRVRFDHLDRSHGYLLELAVFLLVLCELLKPQRILDLGSGFSSVVFRRYMLDARPEPAVCTVDDSPDWLEKTRGFLASHSLPTSDLVTWDSFLQQGRGSFDLVLYDLFGPMQLRIAALPRALQLARAGRIIVLDDIDREIYGPYARRLVKQSRMPSYSLRLLTRDSFGRYALLIEARQEVSASTLLSSGPERPAPAGPEDDDG